MLTKKISSSLEDYLEAILVLEQKQRVARVKDISEQLDVRMPSVTGALKNLRKQGLIEYEKNSFINLTPEGKKIAECVLSRHRIILRFFNEVLGLEGEWVEDQACSIEHFLNHETAVRLSGLTDWLTENIIEKGEIDREKWIGMLSSKRMLHS